MAPHDVFPPKKQRKGRGAGSANRYAAANVLQFEPLEARLLLSADLNPATTGAVTMGSVLKTQPAVVLQSSQNSAAAISSAAPVVSGSLDVPGQANRYSFTLTQASPFYFDSLTDRSDINWSLTGPQGSVVTSRAFSADANAFSTSPWMALTAGGYTLTVSGAGDATGAYSFRLLDLANATPLTAGAAVSDTVDPGDSTNAYSFAASAGERVYFNAQAGGSSVGWRLLDPFGQQVFQSGFYDQNITLGAGGAYTLLLEGYSYATTPSSYTFGIYSQADQSSALTPGNTVTGSVAQPGQLHTYNFTLSSNSALQFDSLTNDGNLNWSLTGPSGTKVSNRSFTASDAAGLDGSPVLDLPGGAYQLTIAGSGAHTGTFAFRLLNDAQAAPISRDVAVSGTLGDGGVSVAPGPGTETQLFSFSASHGDQVQIVVANPQYNVRYRLIDPSGAEVNEDDLNTSGTLALSLTGTYTLSLEGDVSNTGPVAYSFTVASRGTTSIAPLTGTPLTLGSGVGDTFTVAGQVDDYVFTTTGPKQLLFDPLTTPYRTSLSATWQVDGPDGVVIGAQNFYYNQLLNLTVAGTYRVRVIGPAAGQTYGFQLLDVGAATQIAYGSVVTASLPQPNATSIYKFTAQAGDTVYFDTSASTGSLYWRLVDPYGGDVFNQAFSPVATTTLTAGGVYTLIVGGQYYNNTASSFGFQLSHVVNTTTAVTLGVNPSPGPTWTTGKFGDGLQLSGADGLSIADSPALDLTGDVTVEAWVKVDRFTNTWIPVVVKSGVPGSATYLQRTYALLLNSNGSVFFGTASASGSSYSVQSAGGLVVLGQWVDIAGVIDRTNGQIYVYVNGVEQASASVSAAPAPVFASPLLIGQTPEVDPTYGTFEGTIDDVRVWSVARTAAQIAAAMNAPLSAGQTGLALYLKLDEGSGTTAADSSGNGNTATLMSLNGSGITGRIAVPGQQANYTFKLLSPTTLFFDVLSDSDQNLYWTLTGPSGVVVSQRGFFSSDANRGNPLLPLLPAGSYTLTIGATSDNVGAFNVQLLPVSAATPLTPGTPLAVTLLPGTRTQAYSFTATAGKQVFFDATNGSNQIYVHVFDPLGHDILGGAQYWSNLPGLGVQTLAIAGTYTVLVDADPYYSANGGSVTLDVQPVVNTTTAVTLGVNPLPGPIWTTGKFGDGLQLSGADGLSVADSPALDLTGNVTVEAWVKVDRFTNTWIPVVVKSGLPGSATYLQRTYVLFLNSNGSVFFGTASASGSSYSVQSAGGLVVPGQWVDIAGVIDRTNGQMYVYVNGVEQASASVGAAPAPVFASPLLIGQTPEYDPTYGTFEGTIDDVRVWSVARTAAQIAAAMNAPLSAGQTGLALYLKLDEGSGTTAADSSGNGNTATLVSLNGSGITGRIAVPGQQANYTFTLSSPTTLFFDVLSDSDRNLYWTLTGPSGVVVSQRGFFSSDANRGNPLLPLLPAGSYTLTIGATSDNVGAFNVQLLPVSAATPLTPGTPVAVALLPETKTQAYSFTAAAGEQVFFDATNGSSGAIYVHVFDPLGARCPWWRAVLVEPSRSWGADIGDCRHLYRAGGRRPVLLR